MRQKIRHLCLVVVDRKKKIACSTTTVQLVLPEELFSVEDTLKTADVRGNELNVEAENQRKGSFFQGVTCCAVGRSGNYWESGEIADIWPHCFSKGSLEEFEEDAESDG